MTSKDFSEALSRGILLGTFVSVAFNPASFVAAGAFLTAAVLFGFTMWLGRQRIDRADEIEAQVKALKEKIDNLAFAKGMGR